MEDTNRGATTEKREGEGDDNHRQRLSSASLPFGGTAVVVGGGVAGTAAAAELCQRRPDARVTLVARDDKVKVREVYFLQVFLAFGRERKRGSTSTSPKKTGKKIEKIEKSGRHQRRPPH